MRKTLIFTLLFGAIFALDASAQRRGTRATATLAVMVSDPSGTPVRNVLVTVEGAASRSARTEAGRIAFEGLPAGAYKLRFEREGFVTLERELTARGGDPTDVKVTLTPVPAPPPPPAPVAPPPSDVKPVVVDLPAFLDSRRKEIGAGKPLTVACGTDSSASVLRLSSPLTEQAHPEADEFLYVIAGQGTGRIGGREERLQAGVLMLVPRGAAHTLTPGGRGALVVMLTRAGEGCAPAK